VSARPIVLILGDADRAEMRPLADWLNEHVGSMARRVFVREFSDMINESAAEEFPDLIVVLQSWSNEYSAGDANRLLAFAPLARVVVCYGAWCESDGRNQNVWPLSVRVPIWSARQRIEREWQLIQSAVDQSPLPWSASREEIFAADHRPSAIWLEPQRVLIDSPDPAYQQFLRDLLITESHQIVTETPTVLLFDADPWESSRQMVLKTLRDQFSSAKVYVLTNLLPPLQEAELHQTGISVIHKLGFRPWNEARHSTSAIPAISF
jgi:hypothetical protein